MISVTTSLFNFFYRKISVFVFRGSTWSEAVSLLTELGVNVSETPLE